MSKKKTALLLAVWFIIVSTLYYLPSQLGSYTFAKAILIVYTVLGILLFLAFLLVNGGFSRINDDNAPRIALIKLESKKRIYLSKLFLILAIPFLFIFFIDYLFIILKEKF